MSELRKRLLTNEWVIVAPERASRPQSLGLQSAPEKDTLCPLCAQNQHLTPPTIQSWSSPAFPQAPWGVRALPNKYPALRVEESPSPDPPSPYQALAGIGAHEIFIEGPEHCTSWLDLPPDHLPLIFQAWQERINDLKGDKRLRCTVVFKNQGAAAGATLDHTHSQLVALPIISPLLQQELTTTAAAYHSRQTCLICEMLSLELARGARIVLQNEEAVALAPYASRLPFEIWIIPRKHRADFCGATPDELSAISALARQILTLWKRALGTIDHNLMLHSAPFDFMGEPYYHWHLEMLPRIGRTAGFEWNSQIYINATPSEVAARHLRDVAN